MHTFLFTGHIFIPTCFFLLSFFSLSFEKKSVRIIDVLFATLLSTRLKILENLKWKGSNALENDLKQKGSIFISSKYLVKKSTKNHSRCWKIFKKKCFTWTRLCSCWEGMKIPYTNICIKQNNSAIYIITLHHIRDFLGFFVAAVRLFVLVQVVIQFNLDAQLNGQWMCNMKYLLHYWNLQNQ